MRFVIFSDAHFCLKHLKSASDSLICILEYCKKEKPEAVFFAGDLLDSRTHIHSKVFIDLCSILSEYKIKINCVLGNHDLYTDFSSESVLDFFPYLKTYSKSESSYFSIGNLNSLDFESTVFGLIPWSREINSTDFWDVKYLIGHFDSKMLLEVNTSLNMRLIDFVGKKAFLGHIHHPGATHEKIEVIGPTFRTSFAEENIQPRFIVLDSSSGTFENISLPSPVYKTINYGEEVPENSICRVKIPKTINPKDAIKKYPNCTFLLEKSEKTVSELYHQKVNNKSYNFSLDDIIDCYVETQDTTLDKNELKTLGKTFSL